MVCFSLLEDKAKSSLQYAAVSGTSDYLTRLCTNKGPETHGLPMAPRVPALSAAWSSNMEAPGLICSLIFSTRTEATPAKSSGPSVDCLPESKDLTQSAGNRVCAHKLRTFSA